MRLVIATIIALLMASCAAEQVPQEKSFEESANSADRVFVWTAFITLKVENFDVAYDAIHKLAVKHGGYLTDSTVNFANDRKTGFIKIRVPTDQFYTVIDEIEKLGKLVEMDVNGKEVTEEYVDLKARLNASKATEKRFIELLEKAHTVEDVLKIEKELERKRGEIESLEGKLRVMEEKIEMAAITVNLEEEGYLPLIPQIDWRKTFADSIFGLFLVVQSLIILAGYLLPLALIGVLIWTVRKKVIKIRRKES